MPRTRSHHELVVIAALVIACAAGTADDTLGYTTPKWVTHVTNLRYFRLALPIVLRIYAHPFKNRLGTRARVSILIPKLVTATVGYRNKRARCRVADAWIFLRVDSRMVILCSRIKTRADLDRNPSTTFRHQVQTLGLFLCRT
jgi:hypothetical protein